MATQTFHKTQKYTFLQSHSIHWLVYYCSLCRFFHRSIYSSHAFSMLFVVLFKVKQKTKTDFLNRFFFVPQISYPYYVQLTFYNNSKKNHHFLSFVYFQWIGVHSKTKQHEFRILYTLIENQQKQQQQHLKELEVFSIWFCCFFFLLLVSSESSFVYSMTKEEILTTNLRFFELFFTWCRAHCILLWLWDRVFLYFFYCMSCEMNRDWNCCDKAKKKKKK